MIAGPLRPLEVSGIGVPPKNLIMGFHIGLLVKKFSVFFQNVTGDRCDWCNSFEPVMMR